MGQKVMRQGNGIESWDKHDSDLLMLPQSGGLYCLLPVTRQLGESVRL